MPPKELTRHQLSSKLSYSQGTPAFLQRLKNQVAGVSSRDEDEEFDEWQASSGRPPIPKRPSPPQRPEGDPGSADEDEEEEKPQIVVLKEGKHMSAVEVENEKRRAKGLLPVSTSFSDGDRQPPGSEDSKNPQAYKADTNPSKSTSLAFTSFGVSSKSKPSSKKRKVTGDDDDDLKRFSGKGAKSEKKVRKEKTRKAGALLSFDESNDD